MAGKIWQAGAMNTIPARAIAGLAALAGSCAPAWAIPQNFMPSNFIYDADPTLLWEALIGGIVVCAFVAAVAIWIHSALRRVWRAQLRRNAFISSALHNLSQGVIMTDADTRVVFYYDRVLEIYGLSRTDQPHNNTNHELIELRHKRGKLD